MKFTQWLTAHPKLVKVGLGVAVVALVWFGWSKYRSYKSSQPQYQTAQVEKGTLVVAVTASGQVSTVNSLAVNTSASGVVAQVYVHDGLSVGAGAALAQLDLDQTSKQRYLTALASYNSAKANQYTLQNTLFTTNQKLINDAVARNLSVDDPTYIEENASWKAAEASYLNQQNSIAAAALALQQSSPVIYAPVSGVVTGLTLQKGSGLTSTTSSTTTGQKIASIKTNANPAVAVNLTEIDVPKIKVGSKATITFDAIADKTFTGKVISVDTVGSVTSGVVSYPAAIALDTTSGDILPNMSAQVNIIIATKTDVLLVPTTAVKTQNGQNTVQVLQGKQVQSVDVSVGKTSATQTEIVSGLKEGDTVVTGTITTPTSTTRSSQTQSPFGALRGGFGGGGGARFGR